MDWSVYSQLGIAVGLGLLVGLQRERTQQVTAGIRTFTLITLFGAVIGLIGNVRTGSGAWVVAAGLLAVAGLMVMMNLGRLRSGEEHPGPTTEAAALVMYGVGVLLAMGETGPALTAALVFGALYAVIIFALAAVREQFGSPGTYLVAVLSGLTDMDAITLSTTRLMEAGRIGAETGWRMILLAALSNMVFKGALVAVLGHPRLLRRIIPAFGFPVAGGVLILILWPN